jgi:CheY-like chemotaxis protein
MPGYRPFVHILLVEDNRDEAQLMVEALNGSELAIHVHVASDGEEAMRYLRREGNHAEAAQPHMILLDLHMPRMNGFEVLAEIKEDDALRCIPVIVLTSQDSDRAVAAVYDLHANCFVSKPADLDEFARVVKRIETFWLQVASSYRGV